MNKSSLTAAAIIRTPGFVRPLALIAGALALAAPGLARADVIARFDTVVAIDGGSKETTRTIANPERPRRAATTASFPS